jgi:hypothetical protein
MASADFTTSFNLGAFVMRRMLPVALTLYLWLGLVSAMRLAHLVP